VSQSSRSLHDHPLLQSVFSAASAYQRGELDIVDVEERISAAMSALEGDVPADVREVMYVLDAEVDSIRFTVSDREQKEGVEEAFHNLHAVVSRYDGQQRSKA
jgi:hypothetical protein